MHPLLLVLIAVALGAVGQIFLKQGMGGMKLSGAGAQRVLSLLAAILKPAVFTGLLLYAISTLFWLTVLTTQQLSYVYPMIAVGYVLVTVLSVLFLREQVSALRWLSLLVICAGVAMLAVWGGNHSGSKVQSLESGVQTPAQHMDSTNR